MGKDYILVIDEGTTGTRAILFDKKFQIAEQSYEEFCRYLYSRASSQNPPIMEKLLFLEVLFQSVE